MSPISTNPDRFPGTRILKNNYPAIKKEILEYYKHHSQEIKPNFTPYGYEEKGWKTVNLYSYFLKYPSVCAKFPVINEVVNSIPGMCLTQIAILDPQTRIKAHLGDTNAIVRSHLGIVIPGSLPQLGLRIRSEERCWEEGEVFSFCIVNRHCAWNLTDHYRIILMVDVIKPEFYEQRYKIAGRTHCRNRHEICGYKISCFKKNTAINYKGYPICDWISLPGNFIFSTFTRYLSQLK